MLIEQYMIWIWLGVALLALLVEIFTTDVFSIWFFVGAIVAMILSAIGGIPWYVELIVFVIFSLATLFMVRPFVKKYLTHNSVKTNIDEKIGDVAKLTKEINELQIGELRLNGVIWSAIALEKDETIEIDTLVVIVAIKGNKLVVKRTDKLEREEKLCS
ncbi:MAG: NfeD family protein [Erysipelotrichaceae bacterium]|jgi:membrane protein implicated in regulation of membrane protease activity|nr:NfeD family protein [Erysipelotrichaceae bacterium]